MSDTKVARKPSSTKAAKAKHRKTPRKAKKASIAQQAAEVAKNIGETQLLSDFLSGAGWR